MERHAKQCFACGKRADDARQLNALACELREIKAPVDFEVTVQRCLAAQESRDRFWSLRRYWIYGLEWPNWRRLAAISSCAAILASAAVYLVYFPHDDKDSATRATNESVPPSTYRPGPGAVQDAVPFNASVTFDSITPGPENRRVSSSELEADSSKQENWSLEPADPEYIEYPFPGPSDRELILRLPKSIRMKYGPSSEEYFIRSVSH